MDFPIRTGSPALIFRSLLNNGNSWYTGNTLLLALFVHRLFSQGDRSWCAERKEVLQPVTWVVAVPRCGALPSPAAELQCPLISTPEPFGQALRQRTRTVLTHPCLLFPSGPSADPTGALSSAVVPCLVFVAPLCPHTGPEWCVSNAIFKT